MSSTQWTGALVALVLMVFVVTFAMNYVSTSDPNEDEANPDDPAYGELLNLEFLTTKYPADGFSGVQEESGRPGWQIFWFANPNDKAVTIGLNAKNCSCASVQCSVFSPEAKRKFLAISGLAGIAAYSALPDATSALLDQRGASGIERKELTDQDLVTVPAKGLGWIRMRWTGEKLGPQVLAASLWVSQRANLVALETRVLFYPTIRISAEDKTKVVGYPLSLGQLPYRDSYVCWSSTRDHFEIEAEIIGHEGDKDPFQVEAPVPLTEQERSELETKHRKEGDQGKVLFGYKIPIIVHSVAPDGKSPIDIGLLHRWLEFRTPGSQFAPERMSFQAQILGSVHVGGPQNDSKMNFTSFPRSTGSGTREITIWTDDPSVGLEIDEKTTAPFLKARFRKEPASDAKGRRSWQVEVRVPPNEASGRFPRPDHPRYRDSAVYLTVLGNEKRRVRIPVVGIANLD